MSSPSPAPVSQRRLDRLMLTSLLLSGAFWLVVAATSVADENQLWFAAIVVYVLLGSLAMAELYGRPEITMKQEISTLVVLVVLAALLWIPGVVDPFDWTSPLFAIYFATVCFALWQLPALAGRAIWRRLPRPRRRVEGSGSSS